MSNDLRLLQIEELNMLHVFVDICEKNSLRYFIIGGTLLGAVRNKGFIPWDDDVDVAMPRPDYNRLLSIMREYESKEYYFCNFNTEENYSYAWARMNSKKIKVVNNMANNPKVEPVFIDIIPLDGFPDNRLFRIIHKARLSFWWSVNQLCQFDKMVDQKRQRSWIAKSAIRIAGCFKGIDNLISYKVCLKKLNNILSKYPYDSSGKYIINFLAAYGFQEVFPRKAFEKTRKYTFEDIQLNGPIDYDTVCGIIYGDYMKLPPEDQRNKHYVEVIKD